MSKRSEGGRHSSQGMALVITLIMLSVTLIMAIAFLAVAKRERVSVSTSTDTTMARLASDTALAAAQAQILANVLATNATLYTYNLLVSTNYINAQGFDDSTIATLNNPGNVSYYYPNGNIITGPDFAQNVANLLYLPRAPVMVSPAEPAGRFYLDLNRNGAFDDTGDLPSSVDFAGVTNNIPFPSAVGDPQWVGVLEHPGLRHGPDNKFLARYAFIALPVGESLDINAIHNNARLSGGGTDKGFLRNEGVGSWEINLAAFLADLNTNQWFQQPLTPFASYYDYEPTNTGGPFSQYRAFDDAFALVTNRYNGNYNFLPSANATFPAVFNYPYNIDVYSDGPLQLTTTNLNEALAGNFDNTALPWSGGYYTNRFFTPSDFFNPAKSSGGVFGGFTNDLMNAGTTTALDNAQPTYDRYTFYRMLDQLGTDSLPANQGKLNLNYSNAVVKYDKTTLGINYPMFTGASVVSGAETNFTTWLPLDFFSAAADQMLKVYSTNWFQTDPTNYLITYYNYVPNTTIDRYTGFGLTNAPLFGMTNQIPGFGLTNIPVRVNGGVVYSPTVNRVLQLAANIYDASTNYFFPHIYRPIFNRNAVNGNIFIVAYEQITSAAQFDAPLAQSPIQISQLPIGSTVNNVYGIPWIIGAKKGFPGFSQFVTRNDIQVTRKLQVNRKKLESYTSATAADFSTNQMVVMSLANHMGFSLWNSYAANYVPVSGNISVVVRDTANMVLSNGFDNGQFPTAGWPDPTPTNFLFVTNLTYWPGSAWDVNAQPGTFSPPASAYISGTFEFPFLPSSVYRFGSGTFVPSAQNPAPGFDTTTTPFLTPIPQFSLMATNGLQAYILDGNNIIDYVQFAGPTAVRNLNNELQDVYQGVNNSPYAMWFTNASGISPNYGPSLGLMNQITVSQKGPPAAPASSWAPALPGMPNIPGLTSTTLGYAEAAFFGGFFTPTWIYNSKLYINTNLTIQAPYTPTRLAYDYTIWQVNDPLVHYLTSDLNYQSADTGYHHTDDLINQAPPAVTQYLATVGKRYQPWGSDSQLKSIIGDDRFQYNLALKDPLAYGSDAWDFPTNRYPAVGWLGRVHRGTPWQTVYLKSTNLVEYVDPAQLNNTSVGITIWTNWVGNGNVYDALNSKSIQDYLLFDVFTAAPNDNATRGTLSVNQTHLASWSAILSGMIAISNSTVNPSFSLPPNQTPIVVSPAGVDLADSAVWQIVNGTNGINATRTALYPGGGFPRMGDVLRTPALTVQSPLLNRADANNPNDRVDFDISDEQYEWLPQQMMGLLRSTGIPRYVIYCYGQTLKPAPDGMVLTSSTLTGGYNPFGLVTNYQVVAESAIRAVLTVQPVVTNAFVNGVVIPVTNYTMKVESFNVLPPE